MLKNLLRFIIVLLVLLVFVGYPVWVSRPKELYESELAELRSAAQQRFDELQSQAKDPKTNGYLSPEFFKWWAIKGKETPDQPAELACKAWNQKYSSAAMGEKVDHKQLLKSRDKDYLQARRELGKYLPELLSAYQKEVFVAPSDRLSLDAEMMNFVAVRSSVQAVTGYVESRVAEGDMEMAVDALAPIFGLGKSMQASSTLIYEMLGVAIKSIAFDCMTTEFSPTSDMTTEEWLKLSESLISSLPPEGLLGNAVGSELVAVDNSLNDLAKGDGASDLGNPLFGTFPALPGMLGREMRIYHNNMGLIFQQIKETGTYNPDFLADPGFMSFLTGRVSYLGAVVIPSYEKVNSQLLVSRRKTVGAAAATGLLAYRIRHGKFPESLEKLSDMGLYLPPADFLTYEGKGKSASVRISIPSHAMEDLQLLNLESKSTWFKWDDKGGLFTL
jgi:hypothetical protein